MRVPSRSPRCRAQPSLLMKLLLCPGFSESSIRSTGDILFSSSGRVYLTVLSGDQPRARCQGTWGKEQAQPRPRRWRSCWQPGSPATRPPVPSPPSWRAVTCGRAGMEAGSTPTLPSRSAWASGPREQGSGQGFGWDGCRVKDAEGAPSKERAASDRTLPARASGAAGPGPGWGN